MNREPTAAIILAGGLSTRLGRDKASEVLVGRTMLQRVIDRLEGLVDEYVIVRAPGQSLPPIEASAPVIICQNAGGALRSVYTGLNVMKASRALTVACDMPLLQPALLVELLRLAPGHDAVVPLNGLPEPLCAVYAASCAPAIQLQLAAKELKMTGFYECVDVHYLAREALQRFDPDGLSFLNVNTEEDLTRARAIIEAEEL